MPSGRIIFLNGTSSAGKTTLAHALQEQLDAPWVHIALDQFRDGLPARYRGLNAPPGTTGDLGLNVVPVNDAGTPFTRIQFGEVGTTVLKGMRRAIAAMAQAGNNVIIDDIILEEDFLADYLEVLRDLQVYFVGVRCPLSVIDKRERARPGRFPGTAAGHFDICHAHGVYDVEVDTSVQSPSECAASVIEFMNSGAPNAFARLLSHQCNRD
ncbi:MAG: AAA family ATPase [Pseudomonadales bacterium]|nr:AAA family ATPase [Pseudomonadales bacterium]